MEERKRGSTVKKRHAASAIFALSTVLEIGEAVYTPKGKMLIVFRLMKAVLPIIK